MSSVQKKDKLSRSDILTEEEYVMINSSSPDFKLSKDEQY